jgi:hypothetical protein
VVRQPVIFLIICGPVIHYLISHKWPCRIVLETDGNVIAEKVSGHGPEGAGSYAEQVCITEL